MSNSRNRGHSWQKNLCTSQTKETIQPKLNCLFSFVLYHCLMYLVPEETKATKQWSWHSNNQPKPIEPKCRSSSVVKQTKPPTNLFIIFCFQRAGDKHNNQSLILLSAPTARPSRYFLTNPASRRVGEGTSRPRSRVAQALNSNKWNFFDKAVKIEILSSKHWVFLNNRMIYINETRSVSGFYHPH